MDFKLELETIVKEVEKFIELRQPITPVEYNRWNEIIVKKVESEKGAKDVSEDTAEVASES